MDVVNYRPANDSQGMTAALVVEKRKLLHVLIMDGGKLHPRGVTKIEARHMTPMLLKGKPYPVRRAVVKFRHYGRVFGMTKSAKKFLAGA